MHPLTNVARCPFAILLIALSACGATPTATPIPTPTPVVTEGKYDVGGYKLYMACYGSGSPTVVLDSGLGFYSTQWDKVYPDVSSQTRVCVYDRASLGRSDLVSAKRTGMSMAEDMHALLAKAGISAPYILVGHSAGGFHVRLFHSKWPSEVAGIVLVESSHPDQTARHLAALPPQAADEDLAIWSFRRMLNDSSVFPEGYQWEETTAQVRALGKLGNLPLAVLSRTPGVERIPLPGDLPAKEEQAWQDMQKELAALSSNSTHAIAKLSGHDIPRQESKTVSSAILEVLQKARAK
jgi:pimeloyl-ACP methyl ester carboxylesterase